MNKENVMHPNNGTLFDNKKQWRTDRCNNVDKPWKCYAKWKKLITEDSIFHDFIYMKCPE